MLLNITSMSYTINNNVFTECMLPQKIHRHCTFHNPFGSGKMKTYKLDAEPSNNILLIQVKFVAFSTQCIHYSAKTESTCHNYKLQNSDTCNPEIQSYDTMKKRKK